MATKESMGLTELRRHLQESLHGLSTGDIKSDISLYDALDEYDDLVQKSGREEKVASNLVVTYARNVEKHAKALLENFDSVPNNQIVHCYHVMLQFERSCSELPGSHKAARLELAESIAERLYSSLSLGRAVACEEDGYVASKARGTFHRPDCEWANEISGSNLVEFASHGDAVRRGFRPCRTCKA